MQITTMTASPTCGTCSHITEKGKCELSGKSVNILLYACMFHPAIITPEHSALLEREYERKRVEEEARKQEKAGQKAVRKAGRKQ